MTANTELPDPHTLDVNILSNATPAERREFLALVLADVRRYPGTPSSKQLARLRTERVGETTVGSLLSRPDNRGTEEIGLIKELLAEAMRVASLQAIADAVASVDAIRARAARDHQLVVSDVLESLAAPETRAVS